MDSRQHAEQLTDPVCQIISAVAWWRLMADWVADSKDVARAGEIRKAIAGLQVRLVALDSALAEEIAAEDARLRAQVPLRCETAQDELAGVEG